MKKAIISGLFKDVVHNAPIVQLLIEGTHKAIHIWIGGCEAWVLGMVLERIELDRPMTHDLLLKVIQTFSAKPIRAVIHSLKEGVFYANLFLAKTNESQGEDREPTNFTIDCRASDAIIIAAKLGIPIYVSSEVILETAIDIETPKQPDDEETKFKDFLQSFKLEDLKEYMEKDQKKPEKGFSDFFKETENNDPAS